MIIEVIGTIFPAHQHCRSIRLLADACCTTSAFGGWQGGLCLCTLGFTEDSSINYHAFLSLETFNLGHDIHIHISISDSAAQ
jgi:hypothetical protein